MLLPVNVLLRRGRVRPVQACKGVIGRHHTAGSWRSLHERRNTSIAYRARVYPSHALLSTHWPCQSSKTLLIMQCLELTIFAAIGLLHLNVSTYPATAGALLFLMLYMDMTISLPMYGHPILSSCTGSIAPYCLTICSFINKLSAKLQCPEGLLSLHALFQAHSLYGSFSHPCWV